MNLNRAATVLSLHRQSTAKFGVPSMVRSDRSEENTMVCYYVVSLRGPGRGSHSRDGEG